MFPNGGLLVLDDLMAEGGNDKRVLYLFTKHSHHQNVTVLYLCQDMFPPGKYAKSISRNAHYIVAFKNPRDQLGMRNLLLQAFPTQWQVLQDTFQRLTERPFGYMVLDLHPGSSDDQRILSHLLKNEGCISFKIDMCRFAYTTYDKTLIELRTYVRGLPMEEFEGFLIKIQTLDDTITDFTPPVSDKCVQEYEQ